VPLDEFHDFLVVSGGVAGALIGLLFVAISVAPDRLLGKDASQSHRVRASTALTAFTNALSISLFMLIPDVGEGWTATIVASFGLFFVAGSLVSLLRVRKAHPGELRDAGFLVGVAVVFALQLWFGLRLVADDDTNVGAMRGVCVLVVVCFLVGIARAWELVGGPSIGLRSELAATLRDHERRSD
jgi:Na+/proline symporter